VRPAIYQFEGFSFHPLTAQADRYLRSLDERHWDQFVVAAQILATSLRSGRSSGGRSARVRGTVRGLHELKINMPGGSGIQHRLIYTRDGRLILIARGVDKVQAALSRKEIELAARAVKEYRAQLADDRKHPHSKDPKGGKQRKP
jgi:hypothetical protein